MSDESPTIRVLRGPEHAAMERLIRVGEICAAAKTYLDVADPPRAKTQQGAVTALLVLGPFVPKLGAALVAAATSRPGGAAQLSRVSRDVERVLRDLPPFPDSHRIENLPDGRGIVEDTLGDLLRETALELHDIDLASGVNEAGEHVFTWREESQLAVEMMLLEGLMLKMELMLMSDQRLGFEHAAAAWWYKQFLIEWPTEYELRRFGWRMREWSLADRVVPSLGMTAAEALPHHELWKPLSARQRNLVRSFAASIPGAFIARGATARGIRVEDAFDGRRYEVVLPDSIDPPAARALCFGRLVPRDGGVYRTSPGTVTFQIEADLPDELFALLRDHDNREDRAHFAEMMLGRLRGGTPRGNDVPELTPAEAAEMLEAYERAGVAARVGKGFRVAGVAAQPADNAMRAWTELLRERAAASSGR